MNAKELRQKIEKKLEASNPLTFDGIMEELDSVTNYGADYVTRPYRLSTELKNRIRSTGLRCINSFNSKGEGMSIIWVP